MSNDQTEYELFISYARLDNRPIPDTYPCGWVTALREHIFADQRRYSTERLRIFFDTAEIKDMDDWRHRILGGLRSSKILLVCLSPNYFKSHPCRWEWEEYHRRQTHQLIGADSVATVYFVEVPGSDEQENAKRLAELMRGNFTDLRPWFPAGPLMMQEEEVKRRIDALGLSLYERIERARRARSVPGNVRRTNQFFVGRREELRRLHEQLGVGPIGVVTTIHGLGGQGKSELAYHYANGYADCYPGGLWSLGAEGKKELLPLLGELVCVPQFGYTPSEPEKADPNRLGQAVLRELKKRCTNPSEPESQQGATLIILDNVSEPELLSASQLATLPHRANWLRLAATTQLGPERLAMSGKQLATVPVDSLDENDALTLIRDHQPDQGFSSGVEESAAREIVRELGGFTLAVEQVAICLGLNAEHDRPSAFLKRLRHDGLLSVDDLPKDADVAAKILHQQKQLAPLLRATLGALLKEIPAAGTLLYFAALLPPDSIPWPWLRELTARHHPEIATGHTEWAKFKRRVEGTRLLVPGHMPEVACIHWLVAAYIQAFFSQQLGDDLQSEIRTFIISRLQNIKNERRRLFNEVMTGDPNEAVTGWNVPAVDIVLARAAATEKVDVSVHEDGSFTLSLKDDAHWEVHCMQELAHRQFAETSLDGIEWALRTGEIPDRDILAAENRFVTIDRLPLHNGDREAKIAGLYLLSLASVWCRMGSDRTPYHLAGASVKVFKTMHAKYPDDADISDLLEQAKKQEEMYGWF